LNAAYQAAHAGDLIFWKGGSYPSQKISDNTGLPVGSAVVTIQSAPGETVTMGGLTIYAHDLMVSGSATTPGVDTANMIVGPNYTGLEICGPVSSGCNSPISTQMRRVTVDNVKVNSVFINQSWGATLQNSEVGPLGTDQCPGGAADLIDIWWTGTNEGANGTGNVSILNNQIHSDRTDGSCGHPDGIQFIGPNTHIAGNKMWDCQECIFQGDDYPGNVIENNYIEQWTNCVNVNGASCLNFTQVHTFDSNYIFRYNTLVGSLDAAIGHATAYGNIFLDQGSSYCDGHITYSYNVFASQAPCSGTANKRCIPTFTSGLWANIDVAPANYYLAPTDSCARGAGDPNNYPPTDIDGNPRPQNTPDAGANEIP
jgi:hypothetical protein